MLEESEWMPPSELLTNAISLRNGLSCLGTDPIAAIVSPRLPQHEGNSLQLELTEHVFSGKYTRASDELRARYALGNATGCAPRQEDVQNLESEHAPVVVSEVIGFHCLRSTGEVRSHLTLFSHNQLWPNQIRPQFSVDERG